jgi:hypothetical protein
MSKATIKSKPKYQRRNPAIGVQIDSEMLQDVLDAEESFGVKKTRIISESAKLGLPIWLQRKQRQEAKHSKEAQATV